MTVWRRRQDVPANPLTEDRKRLIQVYMDADEEEARRRALEDGGRQRRDREQARQPKAAEGQTQRVAEAQPPETTARNPAILVEAVPDESAAEAARRFAAAVEKACDQARQEAEEEMARRVAAAVEEARVEARREAAEDAARLFAEVEDLVRRQAAEQAKHEVAAAEKQAHREAAEDAAQRIAATEEVRRETREPVEKATPDAYSVEPVVPEAVEEPESGATVEDDAQDDSGEVLPLHKWVQSAKRSEESAGRDWAHALLDNRLHSQSD